MRLQLLSIFFVTLLFQSFYANGQAPVVTTGYCSTGGGDFDVVPAVGCGSVTVTLKNNVVGAQNVGYITNYDGTSVPSGLKDVFSETYSQPGTYTILQGGSKAGVGFTLCKQVTVYERKMVNALLESCGTISKVTIVDDAIARSYDHLEINWGDGKANSEWRVGNGLVFTHAFTGTVPQISVKGINKPGVSCTGLENILSATSQNISLDSVKIRRVEMTANGTVNILYKGLEKTETEILYGDGSGALTSVDKNSSGGDVGVLIDNLNPDNQYNIQLIAKDACGGSLISDEVGTMILKSSTEKTGNLLEWNKYAYPGDFTGYQLLRDNLPIHGFQSINDTKWVDETAVCGQTYEYRIIALTDIFRSSSAPKKVTMTSSKPEKIIQASVSVSAPNAITTEVVPAGEGLTGTYNLIVERADLGSSNFAQISGVKNQQTEFEDKTVNTASKSYCYRFIYENSCPLRSEPSDPVCSILLQQSPKDISWTSETPFSQGVESYDVIENESNTGATDTPVGLVNSYTLNMSTQNQATYTFQVVAHSKGGNLISFSNIVNYSQEFVLLVPDAFTPNADNINEKFEVKGLFVNTFKMSIFNRWGQVVFQSNDINNSWDGMINGAKAPAGSYVYKAEITDSSDKPFSKSGAFLLIR
ncbi:gliding motility-associated C-terminal domain-containing protein [Dyadobacter subterraneus]|uniref:Gliding motility-associated C-terminal domain-containing protein n=1 Tax=Dyadobacter subterraneus TaxID=2773304 RepID=A0ABR9WKU1_9BACT|nr:gliding motility-associated C-terminal domain-containing protein [Dyadobacter subterraneus]MBE9466121.1 gliding motility-associated C-terminal domain-containing protein [Dyadobacter subterraneus]